MTETHPFESLLKERFPGAELLFRAPGGLLACVRGKEGERDELLRVVLPGDDGPELTETLEGFVEGQERLDHPALLWPEAALTHDGLVGLRYRAGHETSTLADLVLLGDAWSVRDIVSALLAVAEGLVALHSNGQVHGAVAPVTVAISRGDAFEARLFDVGTFACLGDRSARDVLGAGPPPSRRTPPSAASDVRNFGYLLAWLLATARSSKGASAAVPQALVDLATRCARRRPIKSTGLVEELRDIVDGWEDLSLAEADADLEVEANPLKADSGAMKGALVPRGAGWDAASVEEADGDNEDEYDDLDSWAIHSDDLELNFPDGDPLTKAADQYEAEAASAPQIPSLLPPTAPSLPPRPAGRREEAPLVPETGEPGHGEPVAAEAAPSDEEAKEVTADDVQAIEDPTPSSFDPSVWIPKGEVISTNVLLKPDVYYRTEEVDKRRGVLILILVLMSILCLVMMLFWGALRSHTPRSPSSERPRGESRFVLPVHPDRPMAAVGAHTSGLGYVTCTDDLIQLFAADSTEPTAQAFPGDAGCQALALSPSGAVAAVLGDSGSLATVDFDGRAHHPRGWGSQKAGCAG